MIWAACLPIAQPSVPDPRTPAPLGPARLRCRGRGRTRRAVAGRRRRRRAAAEPVRRRRGDRPGLARAGAAGSGTTTSRRWLAGWTSANGRVGWTSANGRVRWTSANGRAGWTSANGRAGMTSRRVAGHGGLLSGRRSAAARPYGQVSLPLGDGVRQPDQGGQPVRGPGPQPDPHPVPFGQTRHGEQAHVPGDRDVDDGRVIQPPVHLRQPGLGNADPAVADLDQHAAAGRLLGGHVHRGVLGGEDRGVLDHLGQQVHDVGDRLPGDRDARLDLQRYPAVLLDLRRPRPGPRPRAAPGRSTCARCRARPAAAGSPSSGASG